MIGYSWLFPPYRWRFDARAVEPVRALALDGQCLRGKCDEDPVLGYELMKRFARIALQRCRRPASSSSTCTDTWERAERWAPSARRSSIARSDDARAVHGPPRDARDRRHRHARARPRSIGFEFSAGQFNMLYALGIGEVPISIGGDPGAGAPLEHDPERRCGLGRALRPAGGRRGRCPRTVRTDWRVSEAEGPTW